MNDLNLSTDRFLPGAALVVGGSGGIGAAVCQRLAQQGSDVVVTYRSNVQAADRVVEAVQEVGQRAIAVQVDATDRDSVVAAVQAAEELGGLHTVVFSAGPLVVQRYVSQLEPADWIRAMRVEADGFFHVVRAALPALRVNGGSIVAITSAANRRHVPRDVLSTAPKAAMEALVRAVAREEGRFGIRANAVAVGAIDAGMMHRLHDKADDGDGLDNEWIDAALVNIPLKRLGTASEVAATVVFLASRDGAYICGQTIAVDGGFST